MKVYIVEYSDYDAHMNKAVFLDKEKAEARMNEENEKETLFNLEQLAFLTAEYAGAPDRQERVRSMYLNRPTNHTVETYEVIE